MTVPIAQAQRHSEVPAIVVTHVNDVLGVAPGEVVEVTIDGDRVILEPLDDDVIDN